MCDMVAGAMLASMSALAGGEPVAEGDVRAPDEAPPSRKVCAEMMAADCESGGGCAYEGTALSAGNKPESSGFAFERVPIGGSGEEQIGISPLFNGAV